MTLSRDLARWLAASRWEALPEAVQHETARALVNWIGCPIWGSRDAAVERTLAALSPLSGPRSAVLLGRAERVDPLKAALLNGTASAANDYDDTHLETVIHPTGPPASALVALLALRPATGRGFLHALALGIEVECRVARALVAPPAQSNGAWYLTGVTGGIGAAAACGVLMGFEEDRLLWAMGLAAARAAGSRETHGSMAKSLVTGCAAEEGLYAALLAEQGLMAPEAPIEGARGLGTLVAEGADYGLLTAGLGRDFELMRNAYKPFPSGIVTHAAITGALELAREHAASSVASVELAVNPLCLALCGRREPQDAAEGSFSVYHWVAVALLNGRIGIAQFSDATVRDPAVAELRRRVTARPEPGFAKDEATVTLSLRDGHTVTRHVAHALGAIERPLDDAALAAKLCDQVAAILPAGRGAALAQLCWELAARPDARALPAAASLL